jgi:hypothetical protein
VRVLALSTLLLACLGSAVSPSPPDLNDYILVAYQLSPAQSAQFSDTDSRLSPFWEEWGHQNADSLRLDYVHMSSADPAYAWNRSTLGFDGTAEDAQLTAKAAYDSNGAYYCFGVVDNSWTGPADWGEDVVDVFIDNLSSSEIWDMDPLFTIDPWASIWGSLSFTYREVQVPCGGDTLPAGFEFNYYDDLTWVILDNNVVLFSESKERYDGLCVEVLRMSETVKCQEWFIPWNVYGVGGTGGMPAAGRQLALVLGYNDSDNDQPGETDALRWKNLCDPWCGQTIDTYGDLEISGISLGQTSARRRMNAAMAGERETPGAAMFTLRGERVRDTRYSSGIMVARDNRAQCRVIVNRVGVREARGFR